MNSATFDRAIDPAILEEAADWLVRMNSGASSAEERAALNAWRERSMMHEQAWQRAESFLGAIRSLPDDVARATLQRPQSRRQVMAKLALLLAAGPVAWVVWRERPWEAWQADYRTATGEQRTVRLADGSLLMLNTASSVEVAFDDSQRALYLQAGEILIETAPDNAARPRPFVVRTADGEARPLGTRFTMRRYDDFSRVAVFEGAVEVQPAKSAQPVRLAAGEQVGFNATSLGPVVSSAESDVSWRNGMLVARQMRLADLLVELGRYRPGVLSCDDDVADLRVSGAFPVLDSERSLALLKETFPLRVDSFSRYWIRVRAEGA